MNRDAQLDHRSDAAEQAAFWLLTLQHEELLPAQRAEFIDWLRESPLHISEMLRACRLQRDLAKFKGWEQVAQMREPELSGIAALLAGESGLAAPAPHRLRNAMLVAASIALLCTLGALVFMRFDQTVLKTELGERREMTLVDGSVVDLAPDSEVVVRYQEHERLIALNHGEALFHVAKNPQRPFIVQAALTRVRAVGTVFNVERGDQGVSVTVVEGRVSVSEQSTPRAGASGAAPAMPLLLGADEQISISLAGRATPVRRVRSVAEVGWATGQLVFENETIAEIARRFNLYNHTQIRIADPELATRRVSGVFRASDPDSFVAFVESAAGAEVTQQDADVITLGQAGAD